MRTEKRVQYDVFFFSSRRRHTRFTSDWSSDVCSSDLEKRLGYFVGVDTSNDDETTNTDSLPDSTQIDDAHKFIQKDKIIIQKNGNKFNRLWSDDSIQEEENVPETSQEEKTRADTWLKPGMEMLVNLEEGGISKEEIDRKSTRLNSSHW